MANVLAAGDRAAGILAQSLGGGGGDAGTSSVLNRLSSSDKSMDAESISIAVGGSGGTGGTVTVSNEGTIVTRGDRAHGIYATSIGGGGGAAGAAFIGEFVLAKPSLSGGSQSNLQVAVGGQGGDGNTGGNVRVENTGTLTTYGEQSYGICVQSVSGGDGGLAITASKDIVNFKEPVKSLMKMAIGGGGGQMEVRIYSSPEVPNPAPAELAAAALLAQDTAEQNTAVQASTNGVLGPMNYRALNSQLGTSVAAITTAIRYRYRVRERP